MSGRHVSLTFNEWELVNQELSDQNCNCFHLSSKQIESWKEDLNNYPTVCEKYQFQRVNVPSLIDKLKSPKSVNILCREYWRSQDLQKVMRDNYSFIGFIHNFGKDVNMNTNIEEWNDIRHRMSKAMNATGHIWWSYDELIDMYSMILITSKS